MPVTACVEECYDPTRGLQSLAHARGAVNDPTAYITSLAVLHDLATPTNMTIVYTVHTKEAPSRPGLGAGMALASLAAALALGLALGRYKEGRFTHNLGERLTPAGWPVSFRIPSTFSADVTGLHDEQPTELVYSDGSDVHASNTLVIGRLEFGRVLPPTWIASNQSAPIAETLAQSGVASIAPPTTREFGPLPGAELRYHLGGRPILMRVGLCPNGTAVYACLIAAGSSRLASRILDDVVESVELSGAGFAAPDASVPFTIPDGARLATPDRQPAPGRPHFSVFSSASDAGFWHADVYEIRLADGRTPADVLIDTARVDLRTTNLPQPRETPHPPHSWRLSGPTQLHDGMRYDYRLRTFPGQRAVVIVGTALEISESEMRRAVDGILASYQPADTNARAEDPAALLDTLPDALAQRRGEGTTETWYLLYDRGVLEGYIHATVAGESAGNTIDTHEVYVHHASSYALSGKTDASVATDLRSYKIEDATRVVFINGRSRADSWKERQSPGEDVNRLVIDDDVRTGGSFKPPKHFVPAPALDEAALRAAKRGKPALLMTTSGNLAVGAIGVWFQPVDAKTLDWSHLPAGSSPPTVQYAVRVDEDCRAQSNIFAFDGTGHLVAEWIGDSLLRVEGSADAALNAFHDTPQFIAVPGSS